MNVYEGLSLRTYLTGGRVPDDVQQDCNGLWDAITKGDCQKQSIYVNTTPENTIPETDTAPIETYSPATTPVSTPIPQALGVEVSKDGCWYMFSDGRVIGTGIPSCSAAAVAANPQPAAVAIPHSASGGEAGLIAAAGGGGAFLLVCLILGGVAAFLNR